MENVNGIDIVLSELIRDNNTKIKLTTPVNPPIKKDDDWRDEDCWDELYEYSRLDISKISFSGNSISMSDALNDATPATITSKVENVNAEKDYENNGIWLTIN